MEAAPYSIEFDFDKASKEWRRNKKYISNSDRGMFEYRCGCPKMNGEPCNGVPIIKRYKRNPSKLPTGWSPCRIHAKKYKSENWEI